MKWLQSTLLLLVLSLTPVFNSQCMKKIMLLQYKQVQKSSWNKPYLVIINIIIIYSETPTAVHISAHTNVYNNKRISLNS